MRIHKRKNLHNGLKRFTCSILVILLLVLSATGLTTPVAFAGTTDQETVPSTPVQKKYSIMTANEKGGYTFYDLNDKTDGNASIEVTKSGTVMVPIQELTNLLSGLSYRYLKSKKTITITNSHNKKKIVYQLGKASLSYYASEKSKASKKKFDEAVYLSEESAAVMVPVETLKYVLGASGYRLYNPEAMQEKGYDTYTYSGLYVFNSLQSITELPKATKVYGISSIIKVTIPEGYAVPQVFELLVKKGVCTSTAELYDAMQNYDFSYYPLVAAIKENPNRCYKLEGYLYPDTYEFYLLSKPQDVIGKFLRNISSKITEEDKQRAIVLGYSMDQILTLASLIEKEASNLLDKYNVSSVIYNRMNINMRLQVDCTDFYLQRYVRPYVNGDSSQFDAYYDTYQFSGLPAGPICNPGRAAISAALAPITSDYLYFYSDKEGIYHFSKDWVKPPKEETVPTDDTPTE